MHKKTALCAALAAILLGAQGVQAAVSPEEAAALGKTLNPLGGEMAGNADGSIPAWTPTPNIAASGEKVGDIPRKVFADEKPVAQITAQNMAQYADKLSEGTQALLKKYPDSFRVDVYPTHRTGLAPQYVYDNTLKNATNCQTKDDGKSLQGCYGGIPWWYGTTCCAWRTSPPMWPSSRTSC